MTAPRDIKLVQALTTSTRPLRVCWQGRGDVILKLKENPEGAQALALDLALTTLAQSFGLPTFEMSTLLLNRDEASLLNGSLEDLNSPYPNPISAGYALCTTYERGRP
jgi:hypothetical protein